MLVAFADQQTDGCALKFLCSDAGRPQLWARPHPHPHLAHRELNRSPILTEYQRRSNYSTLRTAGFSPTGRTLAVATSSDLTLWTRPDTAR